MNIEKDTVIRTLKEEISALTYVKVKIESRIDVLKKLVSELEQGAQPSGITGITGVNLTKPTPANILLPKRTTPPVQNLKTSIANNEIVSNPSANTLSSQATPKLSFLEDYNAFLKVEGLGRVNARKDFLKKYQLKAFDCTNFESRMRDPIPPPVFGSVDSIQKGIYWAIPVQGTKYAVLPNVNIYTENHHKAQAMGDVFISNFVSGSYKSLMVDKPAIFECLGNNWQLVTKGKITLSN